MIQQTIEGQMAKTKKQIEEYDNSKEVEEFAKKLFSKLKKLGDYFKDIDDTANNT